MMYETLKNGHLVNKKCPAPPPRSSWLSSEVLSKSHIPHLPVNACPRISGQAALKKKKCQFYNLHLEHSGKWVLTDAKFVLQVFFFLTAKTV